MEFRDAANSQNLLLLRVDFGEHGGDKGRGRESPLMLREKGKVKRKRESGE